MKQTAVEWLVQKLRGCDDKGNFIFNGVIDSELINQAKEMEKKQIIKFANDYLDDDADLTAEQYYTETYKK
jgi:hypothetical protein